MGPFFFFTTMRVELRGWREVEWALLKEYVIRL